MKNFLLLLSQIILFIFFLSLFGWCVKQVYEDKKEQGVISKSLKVFVSFPDIFSKAIAEVKKLPDTFIETNKDFYTINNLEKDLIVLSSYTSSVKERVIELINLKNSKTVYKWTVKNPFQKHDRIIDPVMLSDSSICYSYNGVSGITKVDKFGSFLWSQDSIIHHHSVNKDKDENIWVCSYLREPKKHIYFKGKYILNDNEIKFIDNQITKLDASTGQIIFHKSIMELLKENNLMNLILKSPNTDDPFHINDVEPALYNSKYFNEGDVFISSRNLSCIFHYRPSTNKLINFIEGGFYCQHDVDILNDSILLFFNNNTMVLPAENKKSIPNSDDMINFSKFHSSIFKYNLASNKLIRLDERVFKVNEIFTNTEGMVEQLNDSTYFVEEQNDGILWVLQNNSVLYKNVLNSEHNGYHHLPNWIKVISYN